MNIFSVSGKRVLLTGGTTGIGLGVAKHLVQQGANVVITGRRDSGCSVANQIGATFIYMDLSQPESVTTSVTEAAEALSNTIDVLILNAGIDLDTGSIDALDMSVFRQVFEVNVFGVAQCLRDALPYLASGSSVIITSSPASLVNAPGMDAYSASKAAINALTKSFSAELAPRGIRVNAVMPGIVESGMSGGSTGEMDSLRKLTLSGVIRKPQEMAGTFQFLASQASEPLTGSIVAADDGLSASLSQHVMASIFGEDNNA